MCCAALGLEPKSPVAGGPVDPNPDAIYDHTWSAYLLCQSLACVTLDSRMNGCRLMHHVYCCQPRLLMFTDVKHARNVHLFWGLYCTVIALHLHIAAVFIEADFGLAGVTWLLSSQVVQMTESIWMEQLKAYSRHVASLGQQIAAEHACVTNWLLHQRGLYALGKLCCCDGG